uniref:Uncharacterized protein n=2 Tax=Cacopsylla melanoneura TaxID=428564 RepID=A0A8D8Q9K6_9HEMI
MYWDKGAFLVRNSMIKLTKTEVSSFVLAKNVPAKKLSWYPQHCFLLFTVTFLLQLKIFRFMFKGLIVLHVEHLTWSERQPCSLRNRRSSSDRGPLHNMSMSDSLGQQPVHEL